MFCSLTLHMAGNALSSRVRLLSYYIFSLSAHHLPNNCKESLWQLCQVSGQSAFCSDALQSSTNVAVHYLTHCVIGLLQIYHKRFMLGTRNLKVTFLLHGENILERLLLTEDREWLQTEVLKNTSMRNHLVKILRKNYIRKWKLCHLIR